MACVTLAWTARPTTAQARQASGRTLVIDGATLIDVVGRTTVPDSVVVIDGSRIVAAGPRAAVHAPAGATTIAAKGKFVMPGLTDAHVHLRDWMPELFLAYGVTAVVDLGNATEWTLALREGVEDGNIRGPRVFTSGGILNGPPKLKSHHIIVQTPAQATEAVAALAARHVDAIKVHDKLAVPLIEAVAAEAHKHRLSVVGHLGVDARDAVLAGLDSITHVSGVGLAATIDPGRKAALERSEEFGLGSFAYMDPAAMRDMVGLLRDRHVFLEPNLMTTARGVVPSARRFPDEWLELFSRPELAYVPADNAMRWRTLFMGQASDGPRRAEYEQGWAKLRTFLKDYVAAGGTVIAGSDVQTFAPAGISLQQELQLYVDELGFTPMDALRAGTINVAGFLHRDDVGAIRPGNLADVIVLRADPLADIRNLRTVDTVIVNGRLQDHSFHPGYEIPIARPDSETSGGNPRPVASDVSPVVAVEGTGPARIVVTGSGFISSSVIRFGGWAVETTFVNRGRLEAEIPATLLQHPGTSRVTVFSPRPDGGESAPVYFIVKFRRPSS